MPVFSVLEFAGLSYSALFQVLAFSVLGCIFFFVCTVIIVPLHMEMVV